MELHGGELTPGEGAHIGKVDFDTSFAADQQEARSSQRHRGRARIPRGSNGRAPTANTSEHGYLAA
jgi:hypothetical protein